MTIPSLPEEQPNPSPVDEQDEIPSAIPQSAMTAISVVVVVAMIVGSATAVVELTDWGLNVAMLLGLGIALVLIVVWLRMPTRTSRR